MKLFDTHCHINDGRFDEDRAEVIARMHEAGIENAVVVGDLSADESDIFTLTRENAFLYSAFGLHPQDADKWSEEQREKLISLMSREKVVALGEIGLDYYYETSPRETQKMIFAEQLKIAYDLGKPVILHIRDAHGDAYDILSECVKKGCMPRGIMHCYTGSLESAKEYIKMGLYISFSGSLTFKNAPKLSLCAAELPLDRLLIETDCPYMAPVPMRGKRNEPSFVRFVCEKLAEVRGITAEEAADATYQNGKMIFGI